MRHLTTSLLATTTLLLAGVGPAFADADGRTERASVGNAGQQSASRSNFAGLSGSGKRVVFASEARTELGAVDPAAATNIFLRDLAARTTTLVSVNSAGGPANRESLLPLISRDGETVVFVSPATNLVTGDANVRADVFARDLAAGTTSLVSLATGGAQGNGTSAPAAISPDGRYVAFDSASSNLVPSTGAGHLNLFVRDRETGTATLETIGYDGSPADGPAFSLAITTDAAFTPDGRVIAFSNRATNLVPGDNNNTGDIFVRDRQEGLTRLVSVDRNGGPANDRSYRPQITFDGRYVVFGSLATDLVENDRNRTGDIFVRDLKAGETRRLTRAWDGGETNGPSDPIALTPNGRYLLFVSEATNILPGVPGPQQHYRLDLKTGEVVLISRNDEGAPGNGTLNSRGGISNSGQVAAFSSTATNLVPADTNSVTDVFVRTVGSKDAVATASAARASGAPTAASTPAEAGESSEVAVEVLQPEGW